MKMFRSTRLSAVLAVAFALAWLAPAFAAVTATAVFVQTPNAKGTNFIQGTDAPGTYKTIYTGGTNGSKITAIYVTSNDPSATHLVTVQLSSSTTQHCATLCYGGVAVTIPLSAGFANAVPAVNVMGANVWQLPIDSDGNTYLYLPGATFTLEATFATALTSTDQINIVVISGDF